MADKITYGEDSSDDEIETEMDRQMYSTLREPKEKPFSFYEFGKLSPEAAPFEQIIHTLSESYNRQRALDATNVHRIPHNQPIQTKTFSIKDFQTTQLQKTKNVSNTISRFRPSITQWDSSFFLDEKTKKEMYRTPDSDPSGTVIRQLGRDEAKGVKKWKPVEVDRQLPVPSVGLYSESYLARLQKHMDDVVARVEKEYELLPYGTLAQSNKKSQMGQELNNLRQNRQLIIEEMNKLASSISSTASATAAAKR